ncbi:MAG: glycosyltransferase family 9 protein [Capsulimonadaceae bacterium]
MPTHPSGQSSCEDILGNLSFQARVRSILLRTGVGLGDTLVCEPAARAVKKAMPNALLTLMIPAASRPLTELGYPGDRYVDYEWPLVPEGTASEFDLVLDLDPGNYTKSFHSTLESGTEFYNLFAHYRPEAPSTLAYARVQEGLRRAGLSLDIEAPYLTVPELDQAWVDQWMLDHNVNRDGGFLLILHPGSGGEFKRWMPERFAAVADYFARAYRAAVVILGGPAEDGLADDVKGCMDTSTGVHGVVNWPLPRVAGLLRRSTVFVGNDAGIGHVAGAVGAKVVTIFGVSNAAMWPPITDRALVTPRIPCCHAPARCDIACLRSVTVYDVIGAVEALLTEVVGRRTVRGADSVCVAAALSVEDFRGGIVFLNREWQMPLHIPRGADFVFDVLTQIEQTHSLECSLAKHAEAKPLLPLLMRHGIVLPFESLR